MSMTALKIMEFLEIFTAYSAITLLLPAWIFQKILKGRSLSEQFLMCYTFGNFFIINIVFALQLLHISNIVTLLLLTILLSVFIKSRVEKLSLRGKLSSGIKKGRKVLQGRLGMKTVCHQCGINVAGKTKHVLHFCWNQVISRPFQWLFVAVICCALIWIYGRQIILTYGYRASDIPVHLDWINQMSRGNLFSDGVYPFGFHCIIYYLHAVFNIDSYVIMCQFFFVEIIYAHAAGLCVAKLFCKSKYLPYAGVLVYILGSFWRTQTYSRYYASLPQEFGMIFVFPSIYFLVRFFQTPKADLKKKETLYQLASFAMAFALTLAIHFYGTMIAGLCCVGIAFGFLFRFLNKEYFTRIMLTGIISVSLAVLPMFLAFVGGTPLQGSLGWGMSVIQGDKKEETSEIESEEKTESQIKEEIIERYESNIAKQNSELGEMQEIIDGTAFGIEDLIAEEPAPQVSLKEKLHWLHNIVVGRFDEFILYSEWEYVGYIPVICIVALFFFGFIHLIFRHTNYAQMLFAMAFSMVCITVLLCSGALGLPTLMDSARCSIYFAYLFWLLPVLIIDAALYLLFPVNILKNTRNVLSMACSLLIFGQMLQFGLIKDAEFSSDLVTSEAITCLENIIYENEDFTWTIVSANDELQMGLDNGWHYETITFLREMETMNVHTKVQVPTEQVYFFVEKMPLNYATVYANSGQTISKKGAAHDLPNGSGISVYAGINRWIVMSKLYYWAEAFRSMYPNEMKIYYETEEFICYKITQNVHQLYNFAIDYGYNTVVLGD